MKAVSVSHQTWLLPWHEGCHHARALPCGMVAVESDAIQDADYGKGSFDLPRYTVKKQFREGNGQ